MNEKRKGPRRQLADRPTPGERRWGLRREFDREALREDSRRKLDRLLDREGRSNEDIRQNAYDGWWDKVDRRSGTDRRSI